MFMCTMQALVANILWAELLLELFTQLVFRHPLGFHFHLHALATLDLYCHFADERVLVETCATFLQHGLSFSRAENREETKVLNKTSKFQTLSPTNVQQTAV